VTSSPVGILADKRLLITGVITKDSIAFHVAEQAQREGASVLLTSFGRVRRMTERAAQRLPEPAEVLELDVNNEGDLEALTDSVRSRWGGVDGALHAIAFAPEDAIGGRFMTTPAASAGQAFQTSAFSLKALAAALAPLMGAGEGERRAGQRGGGERGGGGSIVGLDFDAGVAWPIYDWMGVAKAALESVSRYLARDLGPSGIRVNLVAAGPLGTVAARGIPGFERLAKLWPAQAPLGWDIADPSPVASAICFLLSDYARAITGEILHVDGGFHAVGAPGEL
jgi:enoyl-[acyl-carrier protein] reductase I